MKGFKRNFFIIVVVFFILSRIESLAQNPTPPDQSKSTITVNNASDCPSAKNIEEIAEKVYERNYKISDKILTNAQWLVSIVMTAYGIILGFLSYLTYRHVVAQAEIEIASIKSKSKEAIKNLKPKLDAAEKAIKDLKPKLYEAEQVKKELNSRLDETIKNLNDTIAIVEKEVNIKIKSAQAAAYYDIAISAIEKKRYDLALDLFLVLYKSNYRLREVCYHIGICYKNLAQPDYPLALQFFEIARVEAENSGKEGMVNTIQREIDATRALSQATPIAG